MPRAINSVIVTTDNFDATKAFYVEGLKLKIVAEYEPDAKAMAALWGLKKEYRIRTCLLKRRGGDSHGYFRLVYIEGANGRDIREGAVSADYGIFDIAFVVKNNEEKVASIGKFGYGVVTPPFRYDFANFEGYYVTQAVVKGPNDINISLIERFNAPHPFGLVDESSGFSELADSAQMAVDFDEATLFYHELLGMPTGEAFRLSGPQYAGILGVSADEQFQMRLFRDKGLTGSCLELISFVKLKGRQLERQRSPLNYGLAGLSIAVDDLDAVFERVSAAGSEIICGPLDVALEGAGFVRAFSCYGPSQILCEVFQA